MRPAQETANPPENFLDILCAHTGETNAWRVVPDGAAHSAVIIESFIDDVPRVNLPRVVPHHGTYMLLQNIREPRRGVVRSRNPLRHLTMPDQGVSAHQHIVRLSESNQRITSAEVVAVRRRMNDSKLHFVLRLQLPELGPENRDVIRLLQINRSHSGANDNVMNLSRLAQCRRLNWVYIGADLGMAGDQNAQK